MNNNDWLDIDVLEDYLDGKLDAKAMHRIERLSLEDTFVAEALAGLSQSPKRIQSLSLLQRQLQDRIAQKPIEEKRWRITSQRLSIAAAAAVLFVTVSLLFWMRENNNREQQAANSPKKIDVAISPVETKETPPAKTEDVEKVIAEAKANTYANNAKKKVSRPSVAAVMEVPVADATPAKVDEVASLNVIETLKKNEAIISEQRVLSKEQIASSALAGKVAGLNIRSDKNQIRGIIYGDDKLPLPGASVRLKGTVQGAVTDKKGQFSLLLDSSVRNAKLNITSIGFMPKEVNAKLDQNLSIELKPDNTSLSEVVIVASAYGARRSQTSSASTIILRPEPVGGWDKFETYVIENNRLLKDKKVTGRSVLVAFEFDKDGTPFNIKALKTFKMIPEQTKEEETEAIRLVKEGPKWFLPPKYPNSSTATTVNIQF